MKYNKEKHERKVTRSDQNLFDASRYSLKIGYSTNFDPNDPFKHLKKQTQIILPKNRMNLFGKKYKHVDPKKIFHCFSSRTARSQENFRKFFTRFWLWQVSTDTYFFKYCPKKKTILNRTVLQAWRETDPAGFTHYKKKIFWPLFSNKANTIGELRAKLFKDSINFVLFELPPDKRFFNTRDYAWYSRVMYLDQLIEELDKKYY